MGCNVHGWSGQLPLWTSHFGAWDTEKCPGLASCKKGAAYPSGHIRQPILAPSHGLLPSRVDAWRPGPETTEGSNSAGMDHKRELRNGRWNWAPEVSGQRL